MSKSLLDYKKLWTVTDTMGDEVLDAIRELPIEDARWVLDTNIGYCDSYHWRCSYSQSLMTGEELDLEIGPELYQEVATLHGVTLEVRTFERDTDVSIEGRYVDYGDTQIGDVVRYVP